MSKSRSSSGRKVSPSSEPRRRLRELGIRIGVIEAGKHNAITDVKGVKVGHATVKFGAGALVPGSGPARTGVTVILPHSGNLWKERVSGGYFVLNGNGAVTGLDWIAESGFVEGPIALTNTHSVGDVSSALIRWMQKKHPVVGTTDDSYLPIVGECDDSCLNDLQGLHVKDRHVFQALESASGGWVAEGAVGAGTGMTCYDFKGGIGTASRVLKKEDGGYTVGVLVNCNHGYREQLLVGGVPVGRALAKELMPENHREGSIVIVVATDAPLAPRQLNRLSKRAALGLARTGACANNPSGDFVVAFSTSRKIKRHGKGAVHLLPELSDGWIDPMFEACVEATEEAVLNALCMATTTVGRDNYTVHALPLARTVEVIREYGRALQSLAG